MAVLSPEDVARQYYELFNRRQLDAAAALVSSHAVFHYPHTKEHLIGRAGYRELARCWLTAFPDVHIEVQSITVKDGHLVIAELLGHGTHTGRLAFGQALSLPSARTAEMQMREELGVYDGQITAVSLHFDVVEMLRGLTDCVTGMLPRGG